MATAAKWPTAAMSIADVFGELPNFPPLTLNGAINASVTSIVVNEAIPATWPTLSWLTIDNEIMRVTSYNAGTKTFTVAARDGSAGNAQSTTAATHASGAYAFVSLTAQQWNQVVAEVIALETQALGGIHNPNLVLNSDFSRRTVFGLAMPEVFADLSGTTKIDGGAAGSVASNIFTQGAANNEYAWCAGSFVWRDGRASATFKATATAGDYRLVWRNTAGNYVAARQNAGNFTLLADSVQQATVAQALTLNRWYWLEVEVQGATVIVKLYDTGGTVPGVTKASSTLLQTLTYGAYTTGRNHHISIFSDQAAAQWGGIATGNGGVYVETWLPESYALTFGGTLGGQAVGYDESADAGPLSKQWAIRAYIPATSRNVYGQQIAGEQKVIASTAYAASGYLKVSGKGGSGVLADWSFTDSDMSDANASTTTISDASETAWTRKTAALTTASTGRRERIYFRANLSGTATGTAYFMLPQLEQGSAATAWRGAPADDAPITYTLPTLGSLGDLTTTSATLVEIDSRDLAANVFLPWDATVTAVMNIPWYNSGANQNRGGFLADGAAMMSSGSFAALAVISAASATVTTPISVTKALAAGKHRIAATWATSAGTATLQRSSSFITPVMTVLISRGK